MLSALRTEKTLRTELIDAWTATHVRTTINVWILSQAFWIYFTLIKTWHVHQ